MRDSQRLAKRFVRVQQSPAEDAQPRQPRQDGQIEEKTIGRGKHDNGQQSNGHPEMRHTKRAKQYMNGSFHKVFLKSSIEILRLKMEIVNELMANILREPTSPLYL